MGFDPISYLMGKASGSGGGGGIPLLTRAEWSALTTAQKQAYGLLAIQDTNSGFDRGVLVNGADYTPIGEYLPASNPLNIICDAYVGNFFSSSAEWGDGTNPIIMQEGLNPAKNTEENAIYLSIAESEKCAFVDLGAIQTTYTAYAVMKLVSPSDYTRLLSSMRERQSGYGMLLFGSTVSVSSWASDTSTGVSSTDYIAVAMQYHSGEGAGMVTGAGQYITKSPSSSGQYITIGRTDINSEVQHSEPANLYLRYFGVSSAYETPTQIRTNLENLESVFIQ